MPDTGPTVLPRNAVVPLATAAMHRARTVAVVAAVLAVLFLIAGAADVITNSKAPRRDDSAAILVVAILGMIAAVAMRRARRVARTAERAAADVGSSWTLVGKLVVAADDRGIPAPDHWFRVTGAQRAMLLSMQPATPVQTAAPTSAG